METLDLNIDTMREEFQLQERKKAQEKWQARVDELQQLRGGERLPEEQEE